MMIKLVVTILVSLMLASCGANEPQLANGYVEGLFTYISSTTGGYLETINVERGNQVVAGNKLFSLNVQPENNAYVAALNELKQAKANKEKIEAQLIFATNTLHRSQVLHQKEFLQKSSLDQARSDYDSLIAQRREADATIQQKTAQFATNAWNISEKRIIAPKKGVVFDVYYRTGEYVLDNTPVLAILAKEDIKIVFYVKEPQLALLRLGARVVATCSGAKPINAKVSFVSPVAEYTPPLIFSNDTNSTLVFRIEARFDKAADTLCHPGQPVTVKYGFSG